MCDVTDHLAAFEGVLGFLHDVDGDFVRKKSLSCKVLDRRSKVEVGADDVLQIPTQLVQPAHRDVACT